jgi:photosystem II stability/assembly factor-like uncharacterized protein
MNRPALLFLRTAALAALLASPAVAGIDRFTPFGPWGGTIVDLVVDPFVPTSLLAVTDFFALYRSDDGGHAWAWSGLGIGGNLPARVAADPTQRGSFFLLAYGGVFHSADGGRSWTQISSSLVFQAPVVVLRGQVPRLTLLPGSSGAPPTLLVTDVNRVQRSGDGGVTWSTVYTLFFRASAWGTVGDPTDPQRVWLTAPDPAGGILLTSTDGGQTFARAPATPEPLTVDLILPTRPAKLLANGPSGLFKSTDEGGSWRKVAGYLIPMAYETQTPSIAYATSDTGFFWSADAGETWTPRGAGSPPAGNALLRAAPGTRTLYAWNGPDLVTSPDRGRHWSIVAEGGFSPLYTRLRFWPGAPSTLYAVRDGRGYESTDGGARWASFSPASFQGLQVWDLAINPANPDILYAGTDHGLLQSLDGGGSWALLSNQKVSLLVALDRRTLVGASCAISRSRDGGRTWIVTLPCAAAGARSIDRLLVDPRNSNVVYAGGDENTLGPHLKRIWKSADGGATWQEIVFDGKALALDPTRSGRLYVSRAGGLVRSDDGGRSFKVISSFGGTGSGFEVQDLRVDPQTPSTLYAAAGTRGVYRSTDGGATWARTSEGLLTFSGFVDAERLFVDPTVAHRVFVVNDDGLLENRFRQP